MVCEMLVHHNQPITPKKMMCWERVLFKTELLKMGYRSTLCHRAGYGKYNEFHGISSYPRSASWSPHETA